MNRAERQELAAVIDDVRAWATTAAWIRFLAAHFPISGVVALQPDEEALVGLVEHVANRDLGDGARLTKRRLFAGRKALASAREAAPRLAAIHAEICASGRNEVLDKIRQRYAEGLEHERDRLRAILEGLDHSRSLAAQILEDVHHLPITRGGVLTDAEEVALTSLVSVVDPHRAWGGALLDPYYCGRHDCAQAHASAAVLTDVHAEVRTAGLAQEVRSLASSVGRRLGAERRDLQRLHSQVSDWPRLVDQVFKDRADAPELIRAGLSAAMQATGQLSLGSATAQLVPLSSGDQSIVRNLKMLRDSPLTAEDEALLTQARGSANALIDAMSSGFNSSWECTRDGRCIRAHSLIPEVHALVSRVAPRLRHLNRSADAHEPSDLDELLDPTLGFQNYLPSGVRAHELLDAKLISRSHDGLGAIANSRRATKEAATAAKTAADTVRAGDVASALGAMDLDVLRKASPESLRTAPLAKAGLHNVWDVLKFEEEHYLEYLPGLGEASAWSIAQAALRLFEGVRDETPIRIDVKARRKGTTVLLEALRRWDAARRFEPTKDEVAVAKALLKLPRTPTQVLVLAPVGAREVLTVAPLLSDALDRSAPSTSGDVWKDFLSRPSDYFGMLTELGFVTEDEAKMHGDLPDEIVEAVRAKELKRNHLIASLRAYQSFGARFALVQEKVVIGDEMGLGKTVEALAMVAHLRASGQTHFLVVCPAAVVSNWLRETSKHTTLSAFRLHGPQWERSYAAKSWIRNGGVAVTTYDLLPWAQGLMNETELDCAIFDEAHYIKNTTAKRSMAAQDVIDSVRYAVLMTGTPLENRVQEFRNLIGYLREDLAESAPEYLPSKFRKHVAPAYLRRNQEDVLTELPELVEIDEWMGLSTADERAYRAAVEAGHFMLMRRAAMLSERSTKVERLTEIVMEAEENDRRVIVFSYFREVLSQLADLLPGDVYGPLTGSMPAIERQRLIDMFSNARGGAVLISQITAGGVGLNIQSASVVVICEPQLKPTMEAQAIARAHRMGQTSTVQVHRLLTENSVDERIRDILEEKRQLFDEFARDSVIAKNAPDAVDMSDAELARVVIAAERERLLR